MSRKCPKCGSDLSQEMIDVNMCWECGKILDEELADETAVVINNGSFSEVEVNRLLEEEDNRKRIEMAEELKKKKDEMKKQREEALRQEQEATERAKKINDLYEYDVVKVQDTRDGRIDEQLIMLLLMRKAEAGWRLVNTITNEIGVNQSSTGYGGISMGTNATIDETIMIFERCISRYKDNNHFE